MIIERIHMRDGAYLQSPAEKITRDRKKTHTDQAVSFEDKRSDNDQYPHEQQESREEHGNASNDEQGEELQSEDVENPRVNVVV